MGKRKRHDPGRFWVRFLFGFVTGAGIGATGWWFGTTPETVQEVGVAALIAGVACGLLAWLMGDDFWEALAKWRW